MSLLQHFSAAINLNLPLHIKCHLLIHQTLLYYYLNLSRLIGDDPTTVSYDWVDPIPIPYDWGDPIPVLCDWGWPYICLVWLEVTLYLSGVTRVTLFMSLMIGGDPLPVSCDRRWPYIFLWMGLIRDQSCCLYEPKLWMSAEWV